VKLAKSTYVSQMVADDSSMEPAALLAYIHPPLLSLLYTCHCLTMKASVSVVTYGVWLSVVACMKLGRYIASNTLVSTYVCSLDCI
jgi:hypothetical protein